VLQSGGATEHKKPAARLGGVQSIDDYLASHSMKAPPRAPKEPEFDADQMGLLESMIAEFDVDDASPTSQTPSLVKEQEPVVQEATLEVTSPKVDTHEVTIGNPNVHGATSYSSISQEINELRYHLGASKDQRMEMDRELCQKDSHIKRMQLDINNLQSNLKDLEPLRKQVEKLTAHVEYLHKSSILKLEAKDDHYNRIIDEKDREFKKLFDDFDRLKDVYDTLDNESSEKLRELHQMRDQLRIELTETKGTVDQLRKAAQKCSNGNQLQNAVYKVRPCLNTTLHKRVLPCIPCQYNHRDCDSNLTCRHCTENPSLCARWKCAHMHIRGRCPHPVCSTIHDERGFLLARYETPQW